MSAKERFLDYYKKARSKGTYKSYKRGLELFLEWYAKDADTVLAERKQDILSENFEDKKRFDREVEIFYKWELEQGYALTSARTNTLGIIQFFRYFGIPISPTIPMPPPTTKTLIPSIEILRRLFQIGSLRAKVVLSLGLDLSWRISDFIKLKKSDIPDLNQKPPIPIQKVTQKENVISATFLSTETIELLKAYIPTLPKNNDFLFPSNSKHHMKDESINKILKKLARKAKVKIPQGKRLTFHGLRKRFLSSCYSLGIAPEHAKIMVGKSIGTSIETYIQDASFKDSFIRDRETLSLSNGTIKSTIDMKDKKIQELEAKVQKLEMFIEIMTALNNEQLVKKAVEQLKQQGFKETFVFGDKENVYYTHKKDKTRSFKIKRNDATELLNKLAELQQQEQQKQEREEYKELVDANGEKSDFE